MRLLLILAEFDNVTAFIDSLDSEPQTLQFFDKHPEGCWNTRIFDRLTFNDGLIRVNSSLDIIRLDR